MNRAERRRAARQQPARRHAFDSDVGIFSDPGCTADPHLELVGGIMMGLVDPDCLDDLDPAHWLIVGGKSLEWECGCVFRVGRMPGRTAPV